MYSLKSHTEFSQDAFKKKCLETVEAPETEQQNSAKFKNHNQCDHSGSEWLKFASLLVDSLKTHTEFDQDAFNKCLDTVGLNNKTCMQLGHYVSRSITRQDDSSLSQKPSSPLELPIKMWVLSVNTLVDSLKIHIEFDQEVLIRSVWTLGITWTEQQNLYQTKPTGKFTFKIHQVTIQDLNYWSLWVF